MAFTPRKHEAGSFNNNIEYQDGDGLQPTTINNLIENSLYQTAYVESLSQTPDTSQAGGVGNPTVEIIDAGNYKKFKFSNLKGQQGIQGIQGKAGLTFSYNSTTKKLTILTDSDVQ